MKTQDMTTRKSEMRVKNTPLRAGRRAAAAATAGLAVLFAACDVTNPGPVQDEFLSLPEAHQALVNGSHYTLSQSFGLMAYMGAHAGRELLPSGQGGPGGLSGLAQAGRFVTGGQGATGGGNLESAWSNGHEARWIAEEALRRFTGDAAETVDPDVLAEANLWAAYSNRTLGQNMCEAVFDGQGAEPSTNHMVRAEAQFTQALSSGDEAIRNAARAGRAYVRLWLRDLTGAASDADNVPLDFVFEVTMEFPPTATQNPIYAGNENAPVRAPHDPPHLVLRLLPGDGGPQGGMGGRSGLPHGQLGARGLWKGAVVVLAEVQEQERRHTPFERPGDGLDPGRGPPRSRATGRGPWT